MTEEPAVAMLEELFLYNAHARRYFSVDRANRMYEADSRLAFLLRRNRVPSPQKGA